MARIPRIVLLSAMPLSLSPAVSLAQDEGERIETAQATQPQTINPAQGIPDDFTLPPGPTATPQKRLEPMVQPLPQPSASPTTAPTPAREVPQPRSTPVPQQTGPNRTPSGRTVPDRATPPVTRTVAPRAEPVPQVEETLSAVEPEPSSTEQDVAPASPSTRAQPETSRAAATDLPDRAEVAAAQTGWGIFAWLLGGIIVLALGGLAFWLLRQRKEEGSAVEKIEPYRPKSEPDAVKDSPRVEEVPQAKSGAQMPRGLVNVSRPAPATNPGGFVTSSIATRRMDPRGASEQTQSRSNMSSDGRIVTTLSATRTRRD